MVHCDIQLGCSGNGVYYTGHLLKGTIKLQLDQPKKITGKTILNFQTSDAIKLHSAFYYAVYGVARCRWIDNRSKRAREYEGKEVYMLQKIYGKGSKGGPDIVMPSGTHRYDFSCLLPSSLPASLETSHGSIRYMVKSVIDIPWKIDKEFKVQFNVARNDDINEFPKLTLPLQIEQNKRFFCLFCKPKPLKMTVTLPHSGYKPGQNIHLSVYYVNMSNAVVDSTRITLKRLIHFNR